MSTCSVSCHLPLLIILVNSGFANSKGVDFSNRVKLAYHIKPIILLRSFVFHGYTQRSAYGKQPPRRRENGMTGIKICGITRERDVHAISGMGVQVVGIVFTESPRRVLMGEARELVAVTKRIHPNAPDVWGVFAREPVEMISEYVDFLGLDAVQLHGDFYTDTDVAAVKDVAVVRGLSFRGEADIPAAADAIRNGARYVLLDAPAPKAGPPGGTGRMTDWAAAADVAKRLPTVLSGGLTYRNVAQAIRAVRPAMVDVSSGVEMAPGIKDAGGHFHAA